MPDTLKVFLNQVDQAVTPTNAAHSMPLLTTDANTTAVVKDLQFLYSTTSYYKRPMTLSLDGFPVRSFSGVESFTAGGSLIVGPSSTLSLEVAAETDLINYGKLQGLITLNGEELSYVEYDYVSLASAPFDVVSIYNTIKSTKIDTGILHSISHSTATFIRGGVIHFCYANGSSTVQMLGKDGLSLGSFTFGGTVSAICADDTYVYGVPVSGGTFLYRYNHTTLTAAANLATSATIRPYGSTNKGFISYYNGAVYTKAQGSDTNVQIVDTTTGTVTQQPMLAENETIGGAITVARDGVAWVVYHGDESAEIIRISDWSRSAAFSTGMSPTTTKSNQCLCIGPGIVLVNDGTYGRSCIIDVNSGTAQVTDATSILSLGNEYSLLAAAPFLGPSTIQSRSLDYSVLVAGVQST